MDGYFSRYDCRWIILQRKASEMVKHIRPFSGHLGNKEFHQCLHSLNLILEELKEKNKKRFRKLETVHLSSLDDIIQLTFIRAGSAIKFFSLFIFSSGSEEL